MNILKIVVASAALAAVAGAHIGEANAQSSRYRYQQGVGAYSDQRNFSTRGTAPETVVDVSSPRHVSVCNTSDASVVVVYDGKNQSLDAGDCIDVEAAKVGVGAEKDGANGHGSYYVGPGRDPEARRSRTGD